MDDKPARANVRALKRPTTLRDVLETKDEAITRHLVAAEATLGAAETMPGRSHGAAPALPDPFLMGIAQAHAMLAIAYSLRPVELFPIDAHTRVPLGEPDGGAGAD